MSEEKQYSWNAEDYARHSSAQQGWARELISKLNFQGYEAVLDIGCGDGRITAEIAEHLPEGEILGVDSSEDMLALARKEFPASFISGLTLVQKVIHNVAINCLVRLLWRQIISSQTEPRSPYVLTHTSSARP